MAQINAPPWEYTQMLTYEDCLALSGLTEEEIEAIS
jgi:hypothetical protein